MTTRRRIVVLIIFVCAVGIAGVELQPSTALVSEGKPSSRSIVSPRTIQFEDHQKTEEARKEAADSVEDVYKYDESIPNLIQKKRRQFFASINELRDQPLTKEEKEKQVLARSDVEVSASLVGEILDMIPEKTEEISSSVGIVIGRVMEDQVTEETLEANQERAKRIALGISEDRETQSIIGSVAASLLEPNSVLDEEETEKRRKAAMASVAPVITTKLEGETIVSKGEIVTEAQVELLKKLGFKHSTFTPMAILYISIFSILLICVFAIFLKKFRLDIYNRSALLALLGVILLIYMVVAKVLSVMARTWSPFWGFLMPSAAVAIIVAVLYDRFLAVIAVVACGAITGMVTGGNFSYVSVALLGGLFPALMLSKESTRSELRWIGLYTSIWLAVVALGSSAIALQAPDLLLHTGIGFLNGALCSVVAMGSLPFMESILRVATNTSLLELASPEHPLLKELSLKAPGTYNHSVIVANLAEGAAKAIGADPLLARVASYYHDLGKVDRPQFFFENHAGSNPHDWISPNLSAIIIARHPRRGAELTEEHLLPNEIVDIIREHHGTGLINYFYDKAQQEAGKEGVEEDRFRYHTPRPHTKVAGLLLLADSVEAAARAMEKPTRGALEQLVEKIIDEKVADGQLDECELCMKDINQIKRTFVQIMKSSYHPRIEYPTREQVTGKRVK